MRRIVDRVLLALWRAIVEFVDDRGHRDAAQIAFFAVLSFVPLAMLLVGGFGLFFEDEEIRRRVVEAVFENVPLSQEADRARLERTVDDALDNTGRLGPISVLLLIAAASGVMGALRHAINQAWDIETRPPLLRRKALDLALVLGAALVLVFSLSLSAHPPRRRVAGRRGLAARPGRRPAAVPVHHRGGAVPLSHPPVARGRGRGRSGRGRSWPPR